MLIAKAYWNGAPFRFREAPENVHVEPLVLRAADFRECDALLWTPTEPRGVAVVAMHPRVDFTRHYLFPALLDAGVTCLGANTRNPNNDLDTVHEDIVLDLAACMVEMRRRGFEHVILLGNSGGGSLSALYQAQALKPAGERIARTPGGMPTRLAMAEMPPADAMIYVAPHPGQGVVLGDCIDPSVDDEADPTSCDASLDMYAADNGFEEPPTWTHYDPAFIARFREAQAARVARLDARARELIVATKAAHRRTKAPGFADQPFADRRAIELVKHTDVVLTIYRTMANPAYVDDTVDPSPRTYGSLLSDRPDLMNNKLFGFARVCTPRAWLSTWSAQSSNANLLRTLPEIDSPTLFISAGADREIYRERQIAPMVAALRSAVPAPRLHVVDMPTATHYFQEHRDELAAHVVGWVREHFSSSAA